MTVSGSALSICDVPHATQGDRVVAQSLVGNDDTAELLAEQSYAAIGSNSQARTMAAMG
jgi:hypothetical protein